MLKKFFLTYLIILLVFNINSSVGLENRIVAKVENQIITSIDINSEYNYLVALNPNIKNSKKEDIIKFSKKSLIQEKIKKIEIQKNFNNPKIPQKFIEQILQNVYSKIGISNLKDFKKYLLDNNVNFENVKKKLEVEALWNELILIKFSSKIKINEKNIKDKIKNNQFLKSYLLSEIFFEVENLNNLEKKFIEISDVINTKGFDFAALKYSISQTSNIGGKLDWISENSLNKNIREEINNIKINNFTKPIIVPGGFLILQVNDVKKTKIEIDIEEEFQKLMNYEKNNQLNQYSKIYFDRIKKNLEISEL